MEKRQRFTAKFKREAVLLLKAEDKPVAAVARQLGVPRNRLYKWVEDAEKKGEQAFAVVGGRRRAPTCLPYCSARTRA